MHIMHLPGNAMHMVNAVTMLISAEWHWLAWRGAFRSSRFENRMRRTLALVIWLLLAISASSETMPFPFRDFLRGYAAIDLLVLIVIELGIFTKLKSQSKAMQRHVHSNCPLANVV